MNVFTVHHWKRARAWIHERPDRGTARIDDRAEMAVRSLPSFDLHARRSQRRFSPLFWMDPGALDFLCERLTQIWRFDVDHFAAAGEKVGKSGEIVAVVLRTDDRHGWNALRERQSGFAQ